MGKHNRECINWIKEARKATQGKQEVYGGCQKAKKSKTRRKTKTSPALT